jgi:hypothetical protein
MREAITQGRNGEAKTSRLVFQALTPFQQDELIEFLKSLRSYLRALHAWLLMNSDTAWAVERQVSGIRRSSRFR